MFLTRVLLVFACWTLVLPYLPTNAQDAPRHGEPAAQTVAQGVMTMPSETMAWRSELLRAVVSPRAAAVPQPGGFVLADTGALAITDANGKPLQRLAPGQATWIEPGDVRAIVSLEDRSAGYLRISLVPASLVPDAPGAANYSDAFLAPAGAVGVDLLRDVLEREEERGVSSGNAPAFLQVTSGKVFVTAEDGEIREVAAGSPWQFQGEVTLSGGSRAPAAFVIARLGPRIPVRIALLDPNATPVATPVATPQATPIALARSATLSVDAWLCPQGYDESAPLLSCTGPAAGVRFTADAANQTLDVLADATGTAVFPVLAPGVVTLRATLPEGASTAVASCRNVSGDALGRVRDSALSLTLDPGANITCSWFIALGDTWPATSLSVSVLACPPGMTAEALHPEYCLLPEPDVPLQLAVAGAIVEPAQVGEGLWIWGPLLESSYDLVLSALPAGFSGAVLDDGVARESGDVFPIDLGDDPAPVRTLYLLQPPDVNAAEIDSDTDRLTDRQEIELGTDPFLADTDGDGLVDGDEVDFYGTDPLLADTDDDGLSDQEEVAISFTNPFLADTDGDGIEDAVEVSEGTDPLDLLSLPATTTPSPTVIPSPTVAPSPTTSPTPSASPVPVSTPPGKGLATPVSSATRVPSALPTLSPEASPISHRLPPEGTPLARSGEAAAALDNDGLATLDEIAIFGTDPVTSDTDGDGMNDGDEVASGRDPLDPAG